MHCNPPSQLIAELEHCGLFGPDTPLLGVYDLDVIESRAESLKTAFADTGAHTEHFFAVKAAAFPDILSIFLSTGIGLEVASPGELNMALRAGAQVGQVVVDSPAKSQAELDTLIELGASVNIDSFAELERFKDRLGGRSYPSPVGLRINPQTGAGAIESTSTATLRSKFGVPVHHPDNYEQILKAYAENRFLTQIHVHTGSQGNDLDLNAQTISAVTKLAGDINTRLGQQQITRIDIGGGLSVPHQHTKQPETFESYVTHLKEHVPELFDSSYTIMTEFGRALVAEAGFALARVEYTKVAGDRHIAITHAGAQLLSRTTFAPESWPVDVEVLDNAGTSKDGPPVAQDVAGPCCFTGDLIAQERYIPRTEPGDILKIHRLGAYYLSSHYRYNELPPPPVVGYRKTSTGIEFQTLRNPGPDFNALNRTLAST